MKLDYLVLGTNDLPRAGAFYDALFAGTATARLMETDRMIYWLGDGFTFAIALPFDEAPARHGNGTMFGFTLNSAEDVERLYKKTLELGGTSEGEIAQRGPYYSAYARDLDGNKLCFGYITTMGS